VLARLRHRDPAALLVHRLDLDTSGLLVAARDAASHAELQREFLRRTVDKRYIAIVEGEIAGDCGVVDLPIRVDLNDRPRQIHDPLHGRRALTEWRVLERCLAAPADGDRRSEGGIAQQTRIALFPRTGRTHQLRVHASHPLGLGTAIVGVRLYGREGPRLMLHAEALTFLHPATGQRMSFESPAPF
jgi:tRNA pseudouridine32 synthase/23S rRNA pseudouridine746 synthase